jgi:hypothetical protein
MIDALQSAAAPSAYCSIDIDITIYIISMTAAKTICVAGYSEIRTCRLKAKKITRYGRKARHLGARHVILLSYFFAVAYSYK